MYRNTSGFLNNTYLFLRYFDKGFSKYIVNYLQTEKIPKKDTIEILEKLAKKKHLSNYDIAIELEKLNTK